MLFLILHVFSPILGHIRVSRDGAEELEQEERPRDRPRQVREIAHRHASARDCCTVAAFVQRDPGDLAQGFVDLDLGCSTILIGQ